MNSHAETKYNEIEQHWDCKEKLLKSFQRRKKKERHYQNYLQGGVSLTSYMQIFDCDGAQQWDMGKNNFQDIIPCPN